MAKLIGLPKERRPLFGSLAGRYPPIPDAFFFDPLPEDELRLWEGEGEDPTR